MAHQPHTIQRSYTPRDTEAQVTAPVALSQWCWVSDRILPHWTCRADRGPIMEFRPSLDHASRKSPILPK
jgi:hypothetical protein